VLHFGVAAAASTDSALAPISHHGGHAMPIKAKWFHIPGLVAGLLLAMTAVGLGQSQAPPKPRPHVEIAMEHLKKAAGELENASHNFGGHRQKALDLVKQAQEQLHEAIAYAKAHPVPAKK
jgi:hypothetical protein